MARRKGTDTPLPTAHPALEPGVTHLMLCSLGQLPLWFYMYVLDALYKQQIALATLRVTGPR